MKVLYAAFALTLITFSAAEIITRGLSNEEEAQTIHKLEKMYADIKKANEVSMEPREALSISSFLFKDSLERRLDKNAQNKTEPPTNSKEEEDEKEEDDQPEATNKVEEQKPQDAKEVKPKTEEAKKDSATQVTPDGKEKTASQKEGSPAEGSKAVKTSGDNGAKKETDKDSPKKKEGR